MSNQIKSKERVAQHGEVFTPPMLANQVLDLLPQELFCSPDTKFLDPVSKSGVFLREIVKRLGLGL